MVVFLMVFCVSPGLVHLIWYGICVSCVMAPGAIRLIEFVRVFLAIKFACVSCVCCVLVLVCL